MTLFFTEMLTRLSCDHLYKRVIAQAQKKYCVKQLNLQILTPPQVLQLLNKQLDQQNGLNKDFTQTERNFYQTSWALNQFKLFAWVSVCYAHFSKKELQQLKENDFKRLSEVFPRKSLDFLEYYIRSLLREFKTSRSKWTEEQTNLLAESIKEEQSNVRWSEISIRLFTKSNKRFFRTSQKCREKWFNHLDPDVKRSKWSQEEDLKLFTYINQYGTKWAYISKLFNGGRTEHMVKNRYNSIVKHYQQRCQKSIKKIVDKIIEDLSRSKNEMIDEQFSANQMVGQVEVSEESEVAQSSLFALSSQSRKQQDTEQIKLIGEANTINSIHQGFLNLDFTELLFSDNNIEMEQRCPKIGDIELLQIEFMASPALSFADENLNALLLF